MCDQSGNESLTRDQLWDLVKQSILRRPTHEKVTAAVIAQEIEPLIPAGLLTRLELVEAIAQLAIEHSNYDEH